MVDGKKPEMCVAVTKALREIKYDQKLRDLKEWFEEKCVYEYIPNGKLVQILDLSFNINILTDRELFVIAKYLKLWSEYNHGKDSSNNYFDLNLDIYFEDSDKKIEELKGTEKKELFRIRALIKDKDDLNNPEWIGVITYEDIFNYDRNGLFKYNLETQRVPKIRMSDNKLYYFPDVDEKTIENIANAVLDGKFQTNTITLNILRDGLEPYVNPSQDDMYLEVSKDTELDIIDGMHRIKGISRAWAIRQEEIAKARVNGKEIPPLKGTMAVSVKNINIKQAKDFIYQESLANQQTTNTSLLYDENNHFNKFIRELNLRGYMYENKFVIYDDGDDKIPEPLLLDMMENMSLIKKFNEKFKKSKNPTRDIAKIISEFEIVIGDIFAELKDNEYYKENKDFYEGRCFLMDLILFFFLSDISGKGEQDRERIAKEMASVAQTKDHEEFLFSYPIERKKRRKLINLLTIK